MIDDGIPIGYPNTYSFNLIYNYLWRKVHCYGATITKKELT